MTDGTDSRCPRCGAHVRSDAPWCTLCYADLRPAPPPAAISVSVPGGVSAPAAEEGVPAELDPLTAPLALVEAVAGGSHAGGDAQLASAPTKAVGWPCTRCETVVPFDDSECPACGSGFLDGASGDADFVQRIGGRGISTGTQVMIMAGGSIGLVALITALLFLAGAIF